MRRKLSSEEKQRLGIEKWDEGKEQGVVLRLPTEPQGGWADLPGQQGASLSGGEQAAWLLQQVQKTSFQPVPSPPLRALLEPLQLELSLSAEGPSWLQITNRRVDPEQDRRQPLLLRSLRPRQEEPAQREPLWWQDPHDEGTVVLFDLQQMEAVSLLQKDGTGVLLFSEENQLEVIPCYRHLLQVEPYAEIEGDEIRMWLEGLEDAWLKEQILLRLEAGTPWDVAVAAGLYLRWRSLPGPQAKDIVQQLLQGKSPPDFDRPWQWCRSLDASQIETLQRLMAEEISLLVEKMEPIEETVNPDDKRWCAELLDWLHRRDDLEGIWLLLRERGEEETLRSSRDALDQRGELWLASLPETPSLLHDPRVQRWQSLGGALWWSRVALSDEEKKSPLF